MDILPQQATSASIFITKNRPMAMTLKPIRDISDYPTAKAEQRLRKAVENGSCSEIEKLLNEGWDINSACWDYFARYCQNALSLSLRFGHKECVQWLLRHVPLDPHNFFLWIDTLCIEAARLEDHECLRLVVKSWLMANAALDGIDYSPLVAAADVGDFDEVEVLLAGLTKPDIFLANLLVIYGCPLSCLEILKKQGLDLSCSGPLEFTPLMCAVLSENLECLRFLLRTSHSGKIIFQRALMFAGSLKNSTCLFIILSFCSRPVQFRSDFVLYQACLYGATHNLQLLFDAGCRFSAMNLGSYCSHGYNPLIAAMHSGNVNCVKLIAHKMGGDFFERSLNENRGYCGVVTSADCLSFVLDAYSFPVDKIFRDKYTLLTLASQQGCLQTVKMLVKRGAKINPDSGSSLTALSESCRCFHDDVTIFLIKHGANVNLRMIHDHTALMECARWGNLNGISLLLSAGADPYAVRLDSDNVVSIAAMRPDCLTLDALLEAMGSRGMGPPSLGDFKMSPLIEAFYMGRETMVESLIARRFYHCQELATLKAVPELRKAIISRGSEALCHMLDSLTAQPLSLMTCSFLTISESLDKAGPPGQRVKRVDKLPLPCKWKRALNYQMS